MTAWPLVAQEARQAGAVGAGPLDAEGADGPERPGPGLELRGSRCRPTGIVIAPTRAPSPVDRHGGVGVLVGVDADDDLGGSGLVMRAGSSDRFGTWRSGGRTGL